jgi:hypothetical protein
MNHQYEVVYNVGLLDDVHNYFPALLYEHGRFQNITHVFQYVRQQMNTRFNLYTYGAGLAQQTTQRPEVDIPTVILTPQMVPTGAPTPTRARTTAPIVPQADDVFTNINAANLLLGLLGAGADLTPPARGGVIRPGADIWTQFRQPVLVRPSAAVIASATERLSGNDLAAGTVCAICQDTIAGNAQARRLRACQHSYHVGCIDQWFERSVYCPTCRHDVREPSNIAANH